MLLVSLKVQSSGNDQPARNLYPGQWKNKSLVIFDHNIIVKQTNRYYMHVLIFFPRL